MDRPPLCTKYRIARIHGRGAQKALPMFIGAVYRAVVTMHHLQDINGLAISSIVTAACDNATAINPVMQFLFIFDKASPIGPRDKTRITGNAQTLEAICKCALFLINPTLNDLFRLKRSRFPIPLDSVHQNELAGS